MAGKKEQKAKERAKPTLDEIALRANTSRSTVSRAFSRPDLLSPKTVEQILSIAEEIGYRPNNMARALSTGRTGNIGLLVPDIANPFFPPLIKAIQQQADAHDLCLFLGSSGESAARENTLFQRLASQTDGIILASTRLSEAQVRAHAERHPITLINRDIAGLPRVLIETQAAVRDAIGFLLENGHRDIAYLSGPKESWSNQQRLEAAAEACCGAGVRFEIIQLSEPTFEGGEKAAEEAVTTGVTAVLAFDDLTAQGVHARLSAMGIAVPRDMSLIGCDDALPAMTYPALSTLSGLSQEAGRHALKLLRDAIEHRDSSQDMKVVLGARFIRRDTAGSAPSRPHR
ncbi:LacI family transcriptional regulator [Agrobacterium tumefaciens]|uniref:LacI family DNA-binding transcriptional regulator n=1 Tax=Rhizobium rhizogenes TaxID=359 RepID=UPI00098B6C80|nr:LacI family DNA-binding transcriptional regulator [Rhizobium rhizogenes]AQS63987.2 LacI family transcriptional regulator [Rhizobium rhizogenes]NSZ81713.1 LacI family transcriptional regulator [Agrobacterium tumefaciens]